MICLILSFRLMFNQSDWELVLVNSISDHQFLKREDPAYFRCVVCMFSNAYLLDETRGLYKETEEARLAAINSIQLDSGDIIYSATLYDRIKVVRDVQKKLQEMPAPKEGSASLKELHNPIQS